MRSLRMPILAAALVIGALASQGQAITLSSLAPGQSGVSTPGNVAIDSSWIYLTSMVSPYAGADASADFRGKMYSAVYKTAAGMAFLFQVENNSTSAIHAIASQQLNYFGYGTQVGYVTTAPNAPGSGVDFNGNGTVTTVTADRDSLGSAVFFRFAGAGVAPGATSNVFIILSDASDYKVGQISAQVGTGDGGVMSASAEIFGPAGEPVPEPGTLVLAGIALPLLGLTYLRRRRRQA